VIETLVYVSLQLQVIDFRNSLHGFFGFQGRELAKLAQRLACQELEPSYGVFFNLKMVNDASELEILTEHWCGTQYAMADQICLG